MKAVTIAISAAMLLLCASAASAQGFEDRVIGTPSGSAMAFDLVVVRPLSLVGTVLGTGLFILALPVTIITTEGPAESAQKLVIEPARFTFRRPLGHID